MDRLKELVDAEQARSAQVSDSPIRRTLRWLKLMLTALMHSKQLKKCMMPFRYIRNNKTYNYALVEPEKSAHEITTLGTRLSLSAEELVSKQSYGGVLYLTIARQVVYGRDGGEEK